jgi:hypothetical protein
MKEMLPTWVGVVMAVSLAIIALSALAVAAAAAGTALGMRAALRALREIAGPALEDVRQLIGTIRIEVDAVTTTSRDIRGRVTRAADAAEARLVQVNDLLSGLQGSVQSTVTDIAGIIRILVRSISFFDWGKKRLNPGRKTGRKKR